MILARWDRLREGVEKNEQCTLDIGAYCDKLGSRAMRAQREQSSLITSTTVLSGEPEPVGPHNSSMVPGWSYIDANPLLFALY